MYVCVRACARVCVKERQREEGGGAREGRGKSEKERFNY